MMDEDLQALLSSVYTDTTIQFPGTAVIDGKNCILHVDDPSIPILATTPTEGKWMGTVVGVTREGQLVVAKITTALATYATEPGPFHTVQRGWFTDDHACVISPSMVSASGMGAIVNYLRREKLPLCTLENGLWVPIETVAPAPVVEAPVVEAPVVEAPVVEAPMSVDPSSAIHDFETRHNGRYRWRKNKKTNWYHVVFWSPVLLDDVFEQDITDGRVLVIQYGDDGPFGDYWRVLFSKLEKK
jgi:hypothetical protein